MSKSFSLSESICKTDNGFVIASQNVNLIFELPNGSLEYRVLGSIPGERFFSSRLVGSIEKYKNKLIFVPGTASAISIFDLDTKEWKQIEIKNSGMIGNVKFLSSGIFKDKILMFGCHYPAIISLDMNSYEIEYDFDTLKPLYGKVKERSDCFFRTDIGEVDGKYFLACCSDNVILKYDPDKMHGELIRVGNENDRFSGIAYDGEAFWISPRFLGDVIKWAGGDEERFTLQQMQGNKSSLFSLGIVIDKDKNIVIPNLDYEYRYNKAINSDHFVPEKSNKKLLFKTFDDGTVSIDANGRIKLDINDEIISYSIFSNDRQVTEYLKKTGNIYIRSSCILESILTLDTYLDLI